MKVGTCGFREKYVTLSDRGGDRVEDSELVPKVEKTRRKSMCPRRSLPTETNCEQFWSLKYILIIIWTPVVTKITLHTVAYAAMAWSGPYVPWLA